MPMRTAVRQQRARLLAGHEQRCGAVGLDLLGAGAGSGHGRRSPPRSAAATNGPEALEVQVLGDAGALEALGQRVQQARPARTPRSGARASRARGGRVAATSQRPIPIVVVLVQRVAVDGRRARAARRRRSRRPRDGAMCTCAASGSRSGAARAPAASP